MASNVTTDRRRTDPKPVEVAVEVEPQVDAVWVDARGAAGQSPRMTVRTALLALVTLVAAACAPRLIPGTEIQSTRDTRAIYAVVMQYREALEKRDVPAILALVAPTYYDTAGTPDPGDDLDRARLEASLNQDLAKADSMKVEFTMRRIDVNGDEAQAEIFFDTFYRVKAPTAVVPRRDSDVQRLKLKRLDGQWKFVSGL
jgi:hypothetical protein